MKTRGDCDHPVRRRCAEAGGENAAWFIADHRTFAGLKTNANSEVLNDQGQPIGGLYAAGNDAASIMGGNYPGGGITLGPALTFGYIVGNHMADKAA